MTPPTRNQAGSLIVVTRDHGEFSLAMSFLRGQNFALQATMLLPDNLYAHHQETAPVPARRYATSDDILDAVEAHQPDLVCLFSGYLFEQGRLLSRESLDDLLRQLRARGCRLLTSDPFLGLARRLTLGQIDIRMFASGQPVLRRWLTRLVLPLRSAGTPVVRVPSLEDVTHLYPTAIPDSGDGVARIAFFNPTIMRVATQSAGRDDRQGPGGPPDPRPCWLFVLSATDLQCQVGLWGLRGFIRLLAGVLWHATEAGRRATLIAPASMVNRLAGKLPDTVELLPGCPFAEFERRILDAEYVFYWNAFSFSQLARLANLRPVFLFDRGHLARTVKPYYEIARACHLGGWEPPYLDQRQALEPAALRSLAAAQPAALKALRERWESWPTPDQVVDRLVRERADLHEPA